jgi:hypothetical protein
MDSTIIQILHKPKYPRKTVRKNISPKDRKIWSNTGSKKKKATSALDYYYLFHLSLRNMAICVLIHPE